MDVKITLVLLVSVVALLVQDGVDGWRIRIRLRRIVDPICRPFCPNVCKWVTKGAVRERVCSIVCRKVCGRKRRDVDMVDFMPLRKQFSFYDVNGDGFVTLYELASVLNEGDDVLDDDLAEAFMYADTNLDGKLTEAEFINGPFLLDDDEVGDSFEIKEVFPTTNATVV